MKKFYIVRKGGFYEKNILLCFIDDIKNSNEFDKFISKFEDRGG
jgi:hypothetical protein